MWRPAGVWSQREQLRDSIEAYVTCILHVSHIPNLEARLVAITCVASLKAAVGPLPSS